ncbi:MAG: hypothetical protein HDR29_05120 [Lachnospiraceae bacterium]|nr:hypothetical protein [Lachnospiraceae bacterium]
MSISGIGSSYNQVGATTNYLQEKASAKDASRKMSKQYINLSITNEGKEHYRNSIQQGGQERYDVVIQRREQLKNKKISLVDYGYELSRRAAQFNKGAADTGKNILSTADKADGYVKAYAQMYDEIMHGYEDGTREIYVEGVDGPRKLTREEELGALDTAYRKTVDNFVTMEQTNQHAREIIGEEAEKISRISKRTTTLAADFLKEQKARGMDKVPENLNERMLSAVASFKEKYALLKKYEKKGFFL